MSNDQRNKFQAGVETLDLDTLHRFARHEQKLKQQAAAEPAAPAPQPSVDDSRLNVFQKRAAAQQSARTKAAPVADSKRDEMNKFQLHDEAELEKRRDVSKFDARVAEQERQKKEWQRQEAPARTASAGTKLTPELVEMRKKAEADRIKQRQPARIINTSVLRAVILAWRLEWEHGKRFVHCEFISVSLNNSIQHRIAAGDEISPEMVNNSYLDAIEKNCIFMFKPGEYSEGDAIVRPRGSATEPPHCYPVYTWPDQAASDAEAAARASIERGAEERKRLLAMDFDSLKKLAQKDFRPVDASSSAIGGVR